LDITAPSPDDIRLAVYMRGSTNPWVHGHAADPLLALLSAILIGALVAGAMLLLR
jgi:hypothetical protein